MEFAGSGSCDFLCAEIKDFTGRRVTQRRQQDDAPVCKMLPDGRAFDPADFTCVTIINPVMYTQWLCNDKIS